MSKAAPGGSKFISHYENGVRKTDGIGAESGVSVFDPVLCELMYKWFTPEAGSIIDCFAGGSVRGIVAAELGFNYFGCDLSKRQIEENKRQADQICKNAKPTWINDDSRNILQYAKPKTFDFMFTCPPYANLEVYSDDPRDISNMHYQDFLNIYREIICKTVETLKSDTFAAIVVGEVRDKKTGNYYNFVGDTIQAFVDAGMAYYNEMILITAIGSLPLRAGKIFKASRKIGKTHQNILVFLKGDAKAATAKLPNLFIKEDKIIEEQN